MKLGNAATGEGEHSTTQADKNYLRKLNVSQSADDEIQAPPNRKRALVREEGASTSEGPP